MTLLNTFPQAQGFGTSIPMRTVETRPLMCHVPRVKGLAVQ